MTESQQLLQLKKELEQQISRLIKLSERSHHRCAGISKSEKTVFWIMTVLGGIPAILLWIGFIIVLFLGL